MRERNVVWSEEVSSEMGRSVSAAAFLLAIVSVSILTAALLQASITERAHGNTTTENATVAAPADNQAAVQRAKAAS
ncbi:MAG: hypothetical protein AAF850_11865 [Pseudomonadota bacterium]